MTVNQETLATLPCLYHGGRTRVLLQRHSGYGVPVVYKVGQQRHGQSTQAARFANEYRLASAFTHPALRKAYASTICQDRPVLTLAYIEGETLQEAFIRNRRGLAQILAAARSLAEALVEMHRLGIIHRNLHGGNILIRQQDGTAVIIDFGMATGSDLRDERQGVLDPFTGSLATVAPEQTGRMNRSVDHRADLYSLGILLYAMFSGRLPFEATDPATLIHSHIAIRPQPLAEIAPEIPSPLTVIVMKLLAKNAEDRYQSAFGLASDLQVCLDQLQGTGTIIGLPLGRQDHFGRLKMSEKLQGRDQELQILIRAYDRARRGGSSVVLLSGATGTGKSSLVQELDTHVAQTGGLMIRGRGDQYRRKLPYHALTEACTVLVEMLLAKKESDLDRLRSRLHQVLTGWEMELAALVPGLELLLGSFQVPGTERGTIAPQRQLQALRRFFQVIAQEIRPLIVFIDDLQWVDDATLQVLARILIDPLPNLLFIGSICNDTPGGDQVSRHFTAALRAGPVEIVAMELGNLSREQVVGLLADSLHLPAARVEGLASLVHGRTHGNPLFTVELLRSWYENGLLAFNFAQGQWEWDIEQLQKRVEAEDLAGLVADRLTALPEDTRQLLAQAACIGDIFDLATLAAVAELSSSQVLDSLWAAVKDRLLSPVGEEYVLLLNASQSVVDPGDCRFRFTHAHVRQGCLALLPTRQRRLTHLTIGRYWAATERGGEQLFSLVDQYNEGFRHIRTQEERNRLAELNLRAARRAKEAAVWQTAVWYLNMGLGLLPTNRWQGQFELTRELVLEAMEAECSCANHGRALLMAEEALRHVVDVQDRVRVNRCRIRIHVAQDQGPEAMDAALATLENLGVFSEEDLPALRPAFARSMAEELDAAAVIKASQLLAGEVRLEQVLDKLVRLVLEHAGAETGVLILDEQGSLQVQALGRAGEDRVQCLQALPIEQSSLLPLTVVQYVVRTQKPLVLHDAIQSAVHGDDPYIKEQGVRSLLCLPMLHQARLVGMLYLENNLASNVFTPERMELLRALSTQAAIAMENARLYERLQEKIRELGATQQALVVSRNWLDRIINTITDPIFVKDRNLRFVLLNDALCRFIGMDREELLGKSDFDLFSRAEAEVFHEKDQLVLTTGQENINEEQITCVQGQTRTIVTKKTMYVDEDGEPYLVGIVRDITERINLEAQLRQAVKMEAIGTLAGGVAHDFNNLLTAIIGYCELLLARVQGDERLLRDIGRIKKAGQSAASLTAQLLAFSRKQVLQPKVLDLNLVVKDTNKMLQRMIGEDIVLESALAPDLGRVTADPALLEQVIMNLAINARDAMPEGGKLTIETANVYLDASYALQHIEVDPGHYVMLAVSDTGVGLDQETLSHIFEPFFTTKEKGKGTGLGLATVYGIVKQSQGHVFVYSEPGQGASFKVYLPRVDDDASTLTLEELGVEQVPGGEETILLVEDNEMVRDLASAILTSKGYKVQAHESGAGALQQVRELDHPPRLLITDVVMPEMSGRELAAQVQQLHPGLPVIYISGYTGDAIVRHGVLDPGTVFLQKPFTPEALASKVREVLDQG